jgi:hypothetical protein
VDSEKDQLQSTPLEELMLEVMEGVLLQQAWGHLKGGRSGRMKEEG